MAKNIAEEILDGVKTGIIDRDWDSNEELRPKLLFNDIHTGNTVLSSIQKELNQCISFWFSVAFITKSGIVVLKETLKELKERGIKGKILTTDYLSFNEPDALRELLKFENLEVKVFSQEQFHTKGYMFKYDDMSTFVIGSTNLTQYALKSNKEWNLKIASLDQGEMISVINQEFESMWQKAIPLCEQWIKEYEEVYQAGKTEKKHAKVIRLKTHTLKPNKMQIEATRALVDLRNRGKDKALLVSATGTGKTYLSAFDVRNYKPENMLFLVHREQILNQAIESFKDVMGEYINVGKLSGTSKDRDAQYLFSTVQTMSKPEIMKTYQPEHFDYICIDETHRSGAESYQRIINYFKPKFLLGMTATPERTDGFDVFSLFEHNIAYEIRLQQALEEDMLCPFHYFGIRDFETDDGELIDDATEFKKLISKARVEYIIEKTNFYGFCGDRVKGLMFCSRKDEAVELSGLLNKHGYRTVALSGDNSQEERENAIERLEQAEIEGGLDYILTVDIFNEGVDIPEVNQIVMLRPTQSSIIFIQQLGRGLRKARNKEYVVVIDFIGNYKNNFMIPIALSGDRTFNKDTIRKYVAEGNRMIPGCSTIHFDAIAKEKIFQSINDNKITTLKMLREEYLNLKFRIGRIPSLMDFYTNGAVDPDIILDGGQAYTKSYYSFLKKVDPEYEGELTDAEAKFLEFVSAMFASGKRPHELLIIKAMVSQESILESEINKMIAERYGIQNDEKSISAAVNILMGGFISGSDRVNYGDTCFLEKQVKQDRQVLRRSEPYDAAIKNQEFMSQLCDVLDYALKAYEDKYSNRYLNSNLSLYKKYSRKDVCRLLNWEKDESSVIYGYKTKYGTCPIFVTYHKSQDISGSTKYEDQFLDRSTFSWMTRSRLTLESNEVKEILMHQENGIEIHLFIKKEDGEGKDFYYLGRIEPILSAVKQLSMEDDRGKSLPVVNIPMRIRNQVREDIYEYLIK